MEEGIEKNLRANLIESHDKTINTLEEERNIIIKYESGEKMNKSYQRNEIRTSKYSYYNFIFKILFEQFSQAANIYFLILGVLQTFGSISQSGGTPVMLLPLFFVVTVNGIKDFAEDFKRKQSDSRENNTKCLLLKELTNRKNKDFSKEEDEKSLKETYWRKLKPGNIVKIKKDENFPADMVLLYSSNKNGSAFTETKNLDGETNLKYREAIRNIFTHLKNFHSETEIQQLLKKLSGNIECDDPNAHLYEFRGILNLENSEFFEENSKDEKHSHLYDRRKSLYNENEYTTEIENFFKNLLKGDDELMKKDTLKIGKKINDDVIMVNSDQEKNPSLYRRSSIALSSRRSIPEELKYEDSKKEEKRFTQNSHLIQIDYNNILLRGSSLKNTDYVYGIIVYAGHHSKIMMNSLRARTKISRVFKLMNKHLTIIILVQILLSVAFSFLHFLEQTLFVHNEFIKDLSDDESAKGLYYVIIFFSWILTLSNIVPISLLVTIEMIKFCQAFLISWDHKIYDLVNGRCANVQSSGLNEELGQVKHIFTDKTGTLTKNQMVFRYLYIEDSLYGEKAIEQNEAAGNEESSSGNDDNDEGENKGQESSSNHEEVNKEINPDVNPMILAGGEIKEKLKEKHKNIPNVNFKDQKFFKDLKNKKAKNHEKLKNMIFAMAICHSVIPEKNEETGEVFLNSSSPDEAALVNGAKFLGAEFADRTEDNNIIVNFQKETFKYKLLYLFEFNSDRKRMSVVVKDKDNKAKLITKGADIVIFNRIKNNESNNKIKDNCQKQLEKFGNEGLRTLVYAERSLSESDLKKMEKQYFQALSNLKEKNKKLDELYEEFEKDLDIIGVTAVEDCLQDFLKPTLKSFREIGIKVWMLTGDNPFTAVNIAHSCGLIAKDQKTFIVTQKSRKDIKEEFEKIKNHVKKIKKRQKSESNSNYYSYSDSNNEPNEYISSSDSSGNTENNNFCLVITGDALTVVQRDQIQVDTINNNENNNDKKNENEKDTENNKKENKEKNNFNNKNEKERNLENKQINKNPLSSPEKKSSSGKSNDTIKDFKRREEYKDPNLRIAEEQKDYNADNEKEFTSSNHRSKSINDNNDEKASVSSENNKEENLKEKEIQKNKGSYAFEKNNKKKNETQKQAPSKNFEDEGIQAGSLLSLFLEIINSTNTVICSRVSPKQKADLILLVKKYETETMTTLAIGDGANDVNMITAADVGVGIMGNEGQQAARASDYVIGQFSFLKRLLFVHGREAQRKNAFAIGYILWKNFLYVIPMIIFGFFSYFSSQMLYDPYIDICYNILFTAYPIGWFATYDKERNYDELENNPKYYRKGLENGYFNAYVFWQWYFYGLIGGILIFWFVSLVNSRNDLEDLWFIGHTVLLCIVLVVNTKLLIKTKSHNFLSVVLYIFSISSYILILFFSDTSSKLNTYQFFSKMFEHNITFYLLVILIVSSCMMGEYAWETSLILLQRFVGVIQKTVTEIKTKKVNEKKKESMKKEFEANRQKEKENKYQLEQDMSRDYKIDFYSNSINQQIYDFNNKIVSGEEPQIPKLNLNKEDNLMKELGENVAAEADKEYFSEARKSLDDRLLGYTRRYTGFCLPEDKPDIELINHLLIENFVDERIKRIREQRQEMLEREKDFEKNNE